MLAKKATNWKYLKFFELFINLKSAKIVKREKNNRFIKLVICFFRFCDFFFRLVTDFLVSCVFYY